MPAASGLRITPGGSAQQCPFARRSGSRFHGSYEPADEFRAASRSCDGETQPVCPRRPRLIGRSVPAEWAHHRDKPLRRPCSALRLTFTRGAGPPDVRELLLHRHGCEQSSDSGQPHRRCSGSRPSDANPVCDGQRTIPDDPPKSNPRPHRTPQASPEASPGAANGAPEPKPTGGLEPPTPSLRVKCSTS